MHSWMHDLRVGVPGGSRIVPPSLALGNRGVVDNQVHFTDPRDEGARYMPVLERRTLMGVISFYDVAKTVVDAQDFENRMLKAYIRDWPEEKEAKGEQGG